jgi:hypothetical protein
VNVHNPLLAVIALGAATVSGAAETVVARFDTAPVRPLAARDLEIHMPVPVDATAVDGEMREVSLDLGRREDLVRFRADVAALRQMADAQDDSEEAHPERVRPFTHDLSSKGKRRALDEMLLLADALLAEGGDEADRPATLHHVLELFHAVRNSLLYPVKRDYQVVPEIVPILLVRMRARQAVRPAAPAAARVWSVPAPSSFWSDPGPVTSKDLYRGFGRAAVPSYDDVVCRYLEPKTGWGAHPGFDVRCGGDDLKFKLGDEVYGGPFNTRIFDALGYHTTPIDHIDAMKLAYDRRVFTQFHSRRPLTMRAKVLFVPVMTRTVTDAESPFELIESAVMKDGRTLTAAQLESALLGGARPTRDEPRPYTVESHYDPAVESQVAYLVWKRGTLGHEPDTLRHIGPWNYDQLDHADRPEVRAAFVLSAWLDQYNMRWENTRLSYVEEDGVRHLRHVFSDVGSGLGLAQSLTKSANSDVEKMLWEVTERRGDGTVRFADFAPNVSNDAFRRLTWDDARWMLRRIGALSERQVLEGLLATGMSAAEVRLALEKLLSKRRKMIADFGLSPEFPELAARRIDRGLDFDPRDPAQLRTVTLVLADGTSVSPKTGDLVVKAGHLVHRP